MNYALDTCVLSETIKPRPDPAVIEWLRAQRQESLFVTTPTLGELRKGVDRLPASERRHELSLWLSKLAAAYRDRFLPFDEESAMLWGSLCAACEARGAPLPAIDGLIAACALRYGCTLVTRDEADYRETGVPLLNPWGIAR